MDIANSSPKVNLLVIGYGNTLRSDDGVGPRVAEAIEELRLPAVATLSCGLLTPELADPIAQAHQVVFVDASLDLPKELRLRELSPADSSQILAHSADPRTLLALARDIFGNAPKAWWLTIPVESLAIGEGFSTLAQKGFVAAVQQIQKMAQSAQKARFRRL